MTFAAYSSLSVGIVESLWGSYIAVVCLFRLSVGIVESLWGSYIAVVCLFLIISRYWIYYFIPDFLLHHQLAVFFLPIE
jgi:hypothetical protein